MFPLSLLSFLVAVFVSATIVRIGSVALELTGLSKEVASFQALSAFAGVGFTTSESEKVVNHPLRRKIIRTLMFLGNAGINTMIATLVLTFVNKTTTQMTVNFLWLVVGLSVFVLFFRSKFIEKWMRRGIKKVLLKISPSLKILDYYHLLGIEKGYEICRVKVRKGSWLANKTLSELELSKEGILVLGIIRKRGRKESYLGMPKGNIKILPGDILVCYGPANLTEKLAKREKGKEGEKEHRAAIEEQKIREKEERKEFSKL